MAAAPPYALVWLLFVLAWIGNYLVRMGFAALLPPIIDELRLTYTAAGVLASGFFAAYAVMQVPAGILGDRLGRRRVLLAGLWIGAAAAATTGLAVSFATLLLIRLAIGVSQGCLFANDRAIITSVTPPRKMALGQAVSFMGPGLGITAGLLLGGVLGERMSWRLAVVLLVVPTVVAAVLIGRFVPAIPPAGAGEASRGRLRRVSRRLDLWRLALSGLCVMWVQYVIATWGPLLFLEAGVAELGQAGLLASVQGIAGVAGLLGGGWLADRAVRAGVERRMVLVGSQAALAIASAALAAALHRGASVRVLVLGLTLVAVTAWASWGPTFAVLGEAFAGRDLSTAFGIFNSICVLGAFLGPAVTGWVRDTTGSFVVAAYVSVAVALAGIACIVTRRAAPVGPVVRGL